MVNNVCINWRWLKHRAIAKMFMENPTNMLATYG